MTLTDLILLALAGLAINQWWRSRDAKAVALMYAAQRCQLLGLQLLDQSIVREYSFEFSSTGHERYRGRLTLNGHQLLGIELEPHVTLH
jgi:hypothetical protein